MSKQWAAGEILDLAKAFQPMCVLGAAAELDIFARLAGSAFTSEDAAAKLNADHRGMQILLDALASMQLLDKTAGRYRVPESVHRLLTIQRPGSVLGMILHQMNCLRRWDSLAWVVKSGRPAERRPSIRGADADYAAFIEAMDNISGPVAAGLVAKLDPLEFRQVLDVGGASGTWTIALLNHNPDASATIFDLPHVLPQAKPRLEAAGVAERVKLVGGDFYTDELPAGADLAWVSAIVHQNSRQQNRALFTRVGRALTAGGRVLIRDIVMEESRIEPPGGAMFAVNMLAATEAGGTFTLSELEEDLASAGFVQVTLLNRDRWMNSVVSARKA